MDTHHHVWQSLLKGRHADQMLMEYLPEGNFTSSMHSPEDTFWGQLAGCMEMIDCGTTSVVDFSHINYSPEHSKDSAHFYRLERLLRRRTDEQVLAATLSSGIRSVFCYCPTPRLTSWAPFGKFYDKYAIGHTKRLLTFPQYVSPISVARRVPLGILLLSRYCQYS